MTLKKIKPKHLNLIIKKHAFFPKMRIVSVNKLKIYEVFRKNIVKLAEYSLFLIVLSFDTLSHPTIMYIKLADINAYLILSILRNLYSNADIDPAIANTNPTVICSGKDDMER